MKSKLTKYSKYLWLMLPLCGKADIYQKIAANGGMAFFDEKVQGAQILKLPPVNIYSAKAQSATANAGSSSSATAIVTSSYKNFSIAQPTNEQNFQNQPEIFATLNIDPALQAGDNIEWWVDGELYQQNIDTEITLNELARGEHSLQAKLLNAKQHILITTPLIIFYVHYSTAN
jgi:hypothetical protein